MNYLLDTNVLSEFKKKQPSPKVVGWLNAQIEESLFISAINIGEIQKGISALPVSKRRAALTEWLEELIYRYDERILPLDARVLRRWGEITAKLEKRGRILPLMDSLIAATALTHGLTIITRNTDDFAQTEAPVLDIWL